MTAEHTPQELLGRDMGPQKKRGGAYPPTASPIPCGHLPPTQLGAGMMPGY